jgi:hypothetical protein
MYVNSNNMFFARSSPRLIWPAASFVLLCGIYYLWGWSRVLGDFGGDSAYYLLVAKHFSPWSVHSDVAAYYFTHSLYPPLYSLILAMFGGGESLLVAHLVTVTCLLLALVTLYVWLRALDLSVLVAWVTTLLLALMPGTYMEALSVHSEYLYLLLSLVGLLAVTFVEKSGRTIWYWVGALSIAAATLTRGAGISLVSAFVVYLMFRRPARASLYALVSVLPMFLWNVLRDKPGPGYLGFFVEKYSGISLDVLLSNVGVELHAVWYGWVENFTSSPIGFPVMGVVGSVCLMGMAYRFYLRKLDALYSAAYLLLVLIWPFPAEAQRLILVITPVFLAQGLLVVGPLLQGRIGHRLLNIRVIMLLSIFLVSLPALVLTANRFMQRQPDDLAELRHSPGWYALEPREAFNNIVFDKVIASHLRQIEDIVPVGSCIYSIKPSVVAFFANRISMIPPREYLDDAAFRSYLKETNCRYFYLLGFASPSFSRVYYPADRLQNSLKVLSAARFSSNANLPAGVLAELVVQ